MDPKSGAVNFSYWHLRAVIFVSLIGLLQEAHSCGCPWSLLQCIFWCKVVCIGPLCIRPYELKSSYWKIQPEPEVGCDFYPLNFVHVLKNEMPCSLLAHNFPFTILSFKTCIFLLFCKSNRLHKRESTVKS